MKCILRIELHGADAADYNELHEKLEERGITRLMTASDGSVDVLPTGTYIYRGPGTRDQVWSAAMKAAAEVGRAAAIVVVEVSGLTWSGLTSRTPAPSGVSR